MNYFKTFLTYKLGLVYTEPWVRANSSGCIQQAPGLPRIPEQERDTGLETTTPQHSVMCLK